MAVARQGRPLLRKPSAAVRLGVIAFHDAGAAPEQFDAAFDAWATVLPDAVFYAPRAPMPCLATMRGYQWYEIEDIGPENIEQRLAEGQELVAGLIQRFQEQFGLSPQNTIVAGFSQGAVLLTGLLQDGEPPYGQLLSFSGQPIPDAALDTAAVSDTEQALFHGAEDDVVPLAFAENLFRWFADAGGNPSLYVEEQGGHDIGEGSIRRAAEQLQQYRERL
ncbi:hypothetical protein M0534_09055 [Methylonatrum kenyense]|uniref:alpha/beta hydrolase n=1 Tax=Methylonatrum kenyense TaxID=455253 RepID=UPI0020BE798B|nr:hypothetical protein [Methylonatrum kenyense]MCK8516470.1 hypothetical protein [Methylonatrum kenyense]